MSHADGTDTGIFYLHENILDVTLGRSDCAKIAPDSKHSNVKDTWFTFSGRGRTRVALLEDAKKSQSIAAVIP